MDNLDVIAGGVALIVLVAGRHDSERIAVPAFGNEPGRTNLRLDSFGKSQRKRLPEDVRRKNVSRKHGDKAIRKLLEAIYLYVLTALVLAKVRSRWGALLIDYSVIVRLQRIAVTDCAEIAELGPAAGGVKRSS